MNELNDLQKASVAAWLEQETRDRKLKWERLVQVVKDGSIPQEHEKVKNAAFEFAAFSHVARKFSESNMGNNVTILKVCNK